eukprot:CCRYP_002727-RB/>CCRYP_002727-RB protein AED:0.50 eAED:0.59 QI:0/-1/0/1/-1/0/1/0/154
MEPSSILPTSSNTSWHLPPRLNSVRSTSQPAKPSTSASSSKNWCTNNLPHPSKLTAPWLRVSSMAKSNQNKQKQWTCISTGCAIANVKNFDSTGDQENSTTPITGPSITPSPTTKTFANNSSRHTPSSKCYALTSSNLHDTPLPWRKLAQNMPS